MTCRMAVGQRRKQLTNYNPHEQYRGKKKKKLDSSDYILCLRSQVDLTWDVSQKRVVAKKEQIGITWTDMAPFIGSVAQPHSTVADVVSVPREIFDLDNLSEVLTYEVWATCLSESEKKLLLQFLPCETDTEQVVHSLLKGENHHFGNPYLKWSSSLCASNLHPDVVLHAEQQFKLNKRAYYYEINKYHTGMLEVLKKWKERWLSCKDPEKLWSEEITENKRGNLAISAERARAPNFSKREMSFNIGIHNSDTVKYMSCIKITRSQFQLVKNLEDSGDGIQWSKHLSHVLGDINSFHVHPYEPFEEEEQKRLHEHWLQVATKDLPAAFGVYKGRKLQREQCWKSLEQELAGKRKLILDKDEKTEILESSPQKSAHTGDFHQQHKHAPDVEDEKDVDLRYKPINDRQLEHITCISPNEKTGCMVVNKVVGEDTLKQEDDLLPLSEALYSHRDTIKLEGSLPSAKDMWQPKSLPDSYYQTSADQLFLRHKQVNKESPALTLDLERDIPEPEAGEHVASALDRSTIFCSFANQDRTEMLPTFPKGSGMLSSYTHEHMNSVKQPALRSLMANDGLSSSAQLASQCQGQQQLHQREVWEKELYMHQTANNNAYSMGQYPSKGHFPSVDQQGFSAIQSPQNSVSIGYTWFAGENQAYSNWSGVETLNSSHYVGDGSAADGNLYSIFANRLSGCSPFDTVSSEQYIQARNSAGGLTPSAENAYSYARTQLDNSGGDEAGAAPSLRKGSWMNFPHQNPTLHNPEGSPFLRPWNL